MCLFSTYESFACMYIYVSGGQKGLDTPELAGAMESCESPCGVWDVNRVPMQERA